ncbi:MAG TPA: dipeptide ABC transporter ATP-binding protein [Peptococcaceae bacterium]|nr:dipeptide ABC transporter ATP-binding protein [Peptococcaceae bacterium]
MHREKILEVQGLTKYFPIKKGVLSRKVDWLRAVYNVNFSVDKGETFALVGESGCGKSTTRKLLLRLLEADRGQVFFKGKNIFKLDSASLRELRKNLQVVFQDPYASLNPKWRIGSIIEEPLRIHKIGSPAERRARVEELMSMVGLYPEYYNRYPHEFSGGQRQRIGIARALALNPEVIIADEPVSALDVSIQAQILNMFKNLQEKLGLTYIFISHDLSVVKHISDRIAVMYLGEIVELASTCELFQNPKHPYTRALIASIPVPNPAKKKAFKQLEGEVPSPINPPSGCSFHPRCELAGEECKRQEPALLDLGEGHLIRCHRYKEKK